MHSAKTAWLNSLSVKLLLAYIMGAALSIALIVFVTAAIVTSQGDILSGTAVAERARDLAGKLQFNHEGVPVGFDNSQDDPASWLDDSLMRETAYRVLDESGKVVLLSAAGEAFWPADGPARRLRNGRFGFEHKGVAMRAATEAVEHNGRTWFLQFAASTRFLHLIYRAFAFPFTGVGIALFSLVLLVIFGITAMVTLRYTLKPLREISESAIAISPRSIHARLPTEGVPSEIAPLVVSFNRVLERLEQGYRVQQAFLGNAAHELKTPLALIRAQIELRKDNGSERDSLLSDVAYMTRQVQQLLLLAEASEPRNYTFSVIGVPALAHAVVTYLQRMAESADVHVMVSTAAEDVTWTADEGAMYTLLKNLLENAIQHAPAKTCVSVEIHAQTVTVRDHGPGVDAAQIPLMFERFWRGAHRRDHGAGLGLSICQEIALAHGWHLSAERAEPGLRFRLSKTGEDQGISG